LTLFFFLSFYSLFYPFFNHKKLRKMTGKLSALSAQNSFKIEKLSPGLWKLKDLSYFRFIITQVITISKI